MAKSAKPVEFTIEAAELNRGLHNALLFASADRYSPALAAVQIEGIKGGLTFTATDRYCLGETTLPYTAGAFTFLVSAADAKLLRTLFPASSKSALDIRVDGGQMTVQPSPGVVQAPQVVVTLTAESGKFPPVKAILDKAETGEGVDPEFQAGDAVAMNPSLLARFGRVKSTPGIHPMVVRHCGVGKPIAITIGDDFRGVLQPVRLADSPARVVPKRDVA